MSALCVREYCVSTREEKQRRYGNSKGKGKTKGKRGQPLVIFLTLNLDYCDMWETNSFRCERSGSIRGKLPIFPLGERNRKRDSQFGSIGLELLTFNQSCHFCGPILGETVGAEMAISASLYSV